MKYLLLPFLLLLAVEAWAGENCTAEGGYNLCVDRNTPVTRGELGMLKGAQPPYEFNPNKPSDNRKARITERVIDGVSCVDQMEAAMRAMEPYLDKWTYETDGSLSMRLDESVTIPYFSTDHSDPRMKEILKQRNQEHGKAVEQWTTTKRECWKGQ